MKVLYSVEDVKKALKGKEKIGLVPTMGALHNGHLSLIKKAKKECKEVVVSIFVNPTQFLPGEDFEKYPRKLEADMKICEKAKVEFVFLPKTEEIYKKDEVLIKAPAIKGYILEGFYRPGHFDGVLQIVNKLFNIVRPQKAYFGKKDAQQLYLIKKMVKDFFMDIEIVECETIRETNGLALSSRNEYLSAKEREKALYISRSLKKAAKLVMGGEKRCDVLKKEVFSILDKKVDVEYIEIVSREFEKLEEVEIGNSIILIAGKVGNCRLIDNIWL